MTPFMKLFWGGGEQKKMFSVSSKRARYHPMIIRFCFSVQSKSLSAYKEWRDALGKKEERWGSDLTLQKNTEGL